MDSHNKMRKLAPMKHLRAIAYITTPTDNVLGYDRILATLGIYCPVNKKYYTKSDVSCCSVVLTKNLPFRYIGRRELHTQYGISKEEIHSAKLGI